MKIFLLIFYCLVSVCVFSQAMPNATGVVADYKNRVVENGGTLQAYDEAAITSFVTAAFNHQYWSKIIDAGVLAGNNLNASLVKLKYPEGGSDKLENRGFASSDYSPEKGLRLDSLKYLNTQTNLNTLNLKGLFGFSMWLSDQGSGWMGSTNGGIPYSTLIGTATTVNSYMGFPPGYASVGGNIQTSAAFYHVIKQSLDSMKVFVDGNQIGINSNTTTTTQLRDDNVQVFRDASNYGYGLFYCIDNGNLTEDEIKFFYTDVKQLQYDLGRKIAAPLISSNGQYTQTQWVAINQAPTLSSMAGANIYYTLDGTAPTVSGTVYTSPVEISTTTRIRAIAEKNGRVSDQGDAWVAIVPPGFNTAKYYTAHVMINLLAFTGNMDEWLQQMKLAGYNLIWAHLDDYTGNYITTLKSLMDAAARIGGIQVMPGASWWVDPALVSKIFQDTWNHPALFKIADKRVYTGWDYQPNNQHTIDSLLKLQNITKDQYHLWVHSRYPYSWDKGNNWIGQYTTPDYLYWNGSSSAADPIDVDHLYATRPQLDGLINFAVDQGSDNKNIIRTNRLITESSIQRGKFSMAGVSALYASVSFTDFGFRGAAEIWDSVLASSATSRPTALSDITANDYAELSYISPLVISPTNGLSFLPPLTSGFTLGNNIRYPIADHSGIQKFLRPWADAFLNNQPAPSFTEDRMFAWYWLHPPNQAPNPALPVSFNAYANLDQTWWNTMLYATGNIQVGGNNQVDGMKYFFADGMNKIRMAAHLTAPAQLKINDSISEMKPAGAAYYEINMSNFRGMPVFGIVRNGITIKQGPGLQPIVNNVFPGGWNYLSTEIATENFLLPVSINSVRAYQETNGVKVAWNVQNESNIIRYEVEKSNNGLDFLKSVAVQAKGNDHSSIQYDWYDASPVKGNNYYRIKSIDGTGTFKYSNIVIVKIGSVKQDVIIYPNPLKGNYFTVQFDNMPAGVYSTKIINNNGQTIFSSTIVHLGGSASRTISINPTLPGGQYNLQITGNGSSFNKQLLK